MNLVIGRELDIFGSHGMQAHKYPDMLNMIKMGLLSPDVLVTKTVGLSEGASVLMGMGDNPPDGVVVIDSF
jgi:alcohol dehydrogenase